MTATPHRRDGHPDMDRREASSLEPPDDPPSSSTTPSAEIDGRPEPAKKSSAAAPDLDRIRRDVNAAACRFFGDDTLAPDQDGDVPVPLDGVTGYVQVTSDPVVVRIFCHLAGDVAQSAALLLALHRMNATIPLGRLVLTDGAVFVVVEIPGDPFVPAHLGQAWAIAAAVVERYGDEVKALAHGAVLAT